jgi:hypothetical protein
MDSSDENTEYLDLLSEYRSDFTLFSGLSHPDQNGKERRSILDAVGNQARTLNKRVTGNDRKQLDEYFAAITPSFRP